MRLVSRICHEAFVHLFSYSSQAEGWAFPNCLKRWTLAVILADTLKSMKLLFLISSFIICSTNTFGQTQPKIFTSDIDFLVEFLPVNSKEYADNYYDLKFSLERMLNRKIYLLEETTIKNPKSIFRTHDKW